MSRTAIVIVAAALAFAAVTGTIALTKTVRLGRSATSASVSSHAVAKRAAQLSAFEASLHAQLKRKPPAVPKLPVAQTATQAAAPQRVVYVRPAPIVIHKHRAGGEHEGSDQEGGGDD